VDFCNTNVEDIHVQQFMREEVLGMGGGLFKMPVEDAHPGGGGGGGGEGE
jgi:hypothetical protein